MLLLPLAIYLFVCLWTYHPGDPGWSHAGDAGPVRNTGGTIGAWIADIGFYFIGVSAYLMPMLLLFASWRMARPEPADAIQIDPPFRLVGGGYVSPADLDKCIKDGLGLRWAFMGPFETIELNAPGGIPDYCERFGAGWERMSNAQAGTYAGKNLDAVMSQWTAISGGDAMAAKTKWRNRRLAALGVHKKDQPEA